MEWPPTEGDVRSLVVQDESQRVEFKERWYDDRPVGKAEMVKDILALANCTAREEPAYLLAGVRDRRHGGGIPGLAQRLEYERILQVCIAYATPLPDLRLEHLDVEGVLIGVLGIFWTVDHPYYATRDFERILQSSVFYTRRGSIVSTMTPPEIERTIRAKGARLGAPFTDDPLRVGFVERGDLSGPRGPTVRIVNVSGEAVQDVDVVFDARLSGDAASFARSRTRNGGPLAPGEAIEIQFEFRRMMPFVQSRRIDPSTTSSFEKWLDITARVRFRTHEGFLRELQATTFTVD